MPIRRPPVRGLIFAALLVGCALTLAGCGSDLRGSTFDPQSETAQRIYDLLLPLYWAGLAVFIFVEGVLIYSVFRFRRRANAAVPAQIHGNLQIEILWTVAPALIVLVIAILTFRTQALNSIQPADAIHINIVGHQWFFEIQYPDQGITTATDLYVPVNRDITLHLTSKDV